MELKRFTPKEYQAAITEKFPALPIETLRYLAEGWESLACLVNEQYIFRFPKRAYTSDYLRKEINILPELAPRLPLPIPQFQYIGEPGGSVFPFRFVGYPILPGQSLDEWTGELQAAQWWRPAVAEFVNALHTFPVARARELGIEDVDFVSKLVGEAQTPPANWQQALREYFKLTQEKAFPVLSKTIQNNLTEFYEEFLSNPRHFEFEPVLLHCDLWEDHILLDLEKQQVTGIIDFGDVAIGDPALDVWPELLPYYNGKVDATFVHRRDFYYKAFMPSAVIHGQIYNDEELLEEGMQDLEEYFS